MAVIIARAADSSVRDVQFAPRPLRARSDRKLGTLARLYRDPLPHDVSEDEYTVAALFRGSLILNFLTGGAADMTFSARCHHSACVSRGPVRRLAWSVVSGSIDTACAALRGESEHCATAWDNHKARTRPKF